MWTYGHSGRIAVTFMTFTVLACGDDSKSPAYQEDPTDTGVPVAVRNADGGFSMDGGLGMDAARPDGAAVQQLPGDASLLADGAVVVFQADGAVVLLQSDAAVSDMDAASSSGHGDAASDAAADSSRPDAHVGCDVTDSRYGCGTELSPNWLRFASGLEIDRNYERAWSPVFEVANMAELVAKCATLTLPGITAGQFKVPAITDVRTLAGGCDNTVLTSDACRVTSGNFLPSNAGTCSCDPVGVGPDNGKFCHSDVPECVTLWTQTVCGVSVECPMPEVWIYNVTTGAVEHTPEFGNSELNSSAKGRCFTGISAPIP
jgi:hypothetical protein